VLLGLVEDIEDQVPHVLHVSWRGLDHLRVPCGGEDGAGEPSVGRVGLAADEAALLQAVYEMGQAGLLGAREHR
jgi:hypothetical protein